MQKKMFLIISVLCFCVGCDQATKVVAKDYLASAAPTSYAGDIFRLHYAENRGAFLSLGAILPEGARFWIFTILAGLVLLGLLIFIIVSSEKRPLPLTAYTLIVGGGFSNLIDRFLNDGAVVDFMNIGLGSLRTGIFNVADMAITTGVILLVLLSFWPHKVENAGDESSTAEPGQSGPDAADDQVNL